MTPRYTALCGGDSSVQSRSAARAEYIAGIAAGIGVEVVDQTSYGDAGTLLAMAAVHRIRICVLSGSACVVCVGCIACVGCIGWRGAVLRCGIA